MTLSCQEDNSARAEIVRAVVRGKLPLPSLRGAGIRFCIEDQPGGGRRMNLKSEPKFNYQVTPLDIAFGLLEYQDQPRTLRDWASFILCASEIIDLTPLEVCPLGNDLVNALWDASFEGRIEPANLQTASSLATQPM